MGLREQVQEIMLCLAVDIFHAAARYVYTYSSMSLFLPCLSCEGVFELSPGFSLKKLEGVQN